MENKNDKNIVQEKLIKRLGQENEQLKQQLESKQKDCASAYENTKIFNQEVFEKEQKLQELIDECSRMRDKYEKELKDLCSIKKIYTEKLEKEYGKTKKNLKKIK